MFLQKFFPLFSWNHKNNITCSKHDNCEEAVSCCTLVAGRSSTFLAFYKDLSVLESQLIIVYLTFQSHPNVFFFFDLELVVVHKLDYCL